MKEMIFILGSYTGEAKKVRALNVTMPILHISITQSESGIEPDGVANDFRWKTMALEGDVLHPEILHRSSGKNKGA